MSNTVQPAGVNDGGVERRIYTVSARLEVDDRAYDVASVSISLKQNGIPTIALVIPPTSIARKGSDDVNSRIQAVDVDTLQEINAFLQSKVNNPAAVIRFTLLVESPDDTQEVQLTQWIISGAGLTGAGSTGALAASVTLAHPLFRAMSAPCGAYNCTNVTALPAIKDVYTPGYGPIGVLIASLKYYADKAKDAVTSYAQQESSIASAAGKNLDTIFREMIAKQKEGIVILEATTEWGAPAGTRDMPGPVTAPTKFIDHVTKHIFDFLADPATSPVELLLGQLASDYDLAISGAPADVRLMVFPFTPWGKPVLEVFDDEISDLVEPAVDPSPVAAVVCGINDTLIDGHQLYIYDLYDPKTKEHLLQDGIAYGAYLDPLTATPPLNGRIQAVNQPSWMDSYRRVLAAAQADVLEILNSNQGQANTEDAGNGVVDEASLQTLFDAANTWSKASFWRLYRAGTVAGFTSRLMISVDPVRNPNTLPGNLLRPGISVRVKSRQTGAVLFVFYALEVEHHLDAIGRTAYTTLAGAYARPEAALPSVGLTAEEIGNGIPNPLYGSAANGSLKTTGPAPIGAMTAPAS